MMKPAFLLLGLLLCLAACRQKQQAQSPPVYRNDTIPFFPVKDFLESQVRKVDSIPYFLYAITEKEGQKDSAAVSREAFRQAMAAFLQYDISAPAVKKYYNESVFNDESTHSYTLHYATGNKALPVQTVDVLLSQDDQHVKRVFMTWVQNSGDSTVFNRLSWKTDASCTLVSSLGRGNKESVTETTWVWNKKN
jgi:hypothetical protein